MKKKNLIVLTYIIVVTFAFIVIKGAIFGWRTEYINMMPGPIVTIENGKKVEIGYSTGEKVIEKYGYHFKDDYTIGLISLKRTIIFVIINILLTTIVSIILYKKSIFEGNVDILFILAMLVIPIISIYLFIVHQFSVVV